MSTINKLKHNKRVLFILLSALIIAVIFIITLIALSQKKPGKIAFFARSINDASYDCEATIANKYDEKLINKNYDNFSSRYEADKHQYIIYYRISVREETDDRPTIKDYLAKCIVWEKIGYVSDFSIIDY